MRPQWTIRGVARGMAVVLAVTALPVLATRPAVAEGGPSVDPPVIPSVPVVKQVTQPRPEDDANKAALRDDQQGKPPRTVRDGAGTYTATPLSPTATWDVSLRTGDFTWSYPLRVPPAPGGLEPNLALSYRSSAVDGRTSTTNQQPSWIGDGWDLSPGFVERTYGGCADDDGGGTTPPPNVGDLCWRSDNATAAFGGGGGMLIHNQDPNNRVWRLKDDNGARVDQFTGKGNGDNDGEHWRITTVDGTEYWFGSQPDSGSTWTVPVFGDDAGEPCHGATFDASHCPQAWRWNLDQVIDRNGNVIRYFYEPESNSYGMNRKDAPVSYIRGGTLRRIDYGLSTRVGARASGQVDFATADRCVPNTPCDFAHDRNWPDTPLDSRCDASPCKDKYAPTFWTTKRLASVTTSVWRGSSYEPVDRWTLDQQYPDPGDGEKPGLWLKGITHTGLVGGSADLPAVTFEGKQFANRVAVGDGLARLNRFRIVGVVSETGGWTSVNYELPDCVSGTRMPDAHDNTKRCFPVTWVPKGMVERTDWFHKYVVREVVQSDRLSSSNQRQTSYEYLDGAAWHWNMSEFVKDTKKTWDEFRGFGRVRVRTGSGADSPVTMTEQRFYRGMNDDRMPDNGRRTASISSTESVTTPTDHDWLRGFAFESATFERDGPSDQPDPPRVSKSITDPSWQGPTATRGEYKAYLVHPKAQRAFTALGSGGWRVTKTETTYDDVGLPTEVNDLGDPDLAGDDLCTRTTYARDTGTWRLNQPATVKTVSVHCGASPAYPRDAVSATRNTYDEYGNLAKAEVAKDWPAAEPVYVTTGTARYDQHGRALEQTDALGNTTRAAFTPATGGPATATSTTSPPTPAVPDGLVVTTALEPAWGEPTKVTDANNRVTELAYDPLGRRTQMWQANWPRADHRDQGSQSFSYLVRKDGPTVLTTSTVGPNGVHTSANTVFDGFLRPRQVQAPAVGGGRLITDTRYDSHGRAYKTTQPYFNDAPVDDQLWTAAHDADVPGLTRTEFDGAGRQIASVWQAGAGTPEDRVWRSETSYAGDRMTVTPPPGGTPSTQITDARGRLVELRQHRGAEFDATTYRYTPAGQLAEFTTAGGTTRKYGHDLRGRMIRAEDPDRGVSTMDYDDAGQLIWARDARGDAGTVAVAYDSLGRRTAVHHGTLTGPKLAQWSYDTAGGGKGQLATSTRFAGGHAYTSSVGHYTSLYKPLNLTVTIPAVEGLLAGAYKWEGGYGEDGSLTGETYPKAGDLKVETVAYHRDDWGRPDTTDGDHNGFLRLVADTNYTRYGEPQRIELGTLGKRAWLSAYYDTNNRRLARSVVDAEVPAPMQADAHYTTDPAGNITSIADKTLGQPADNQCFRYDHLRRLTEAWTPTGDCVADPNTGGLGGPASYWHSYRYNGDGNRLSETRHTTAGDATRTYTYPDAGQPQPHTLRSVTGPAGTETYGYDPAGNTITRTKPGANETLTWDVEGHLASVTNNGQTTSFIYTADGARLLRKDPTGTTLYLGNQEIRVNASGGGPAATRYYRHGGGAVIAVRQGNTLTWLASDHQATALVTINSENLQVSRRRHLPFGAPRGQSPALWPGQRGFLDGVQDPSTGLTHLGAREYDPDTGRFISADPITDVADPQQTHGYTYANNSPITLADPTGLRPEDVPGCKPRDCGPYTDPKPTPAPSPPPAPILGSDAPGETAQQRRERDLKVKWHAERVRQNPALGLSPETQILNNGALCDLYIKDVRTLDTCKANAGDPDFEKNQLHSHGVAFLGAVADGIAEFMTEVAIEIITSGRGKGGRPRGRNGPERPSFQGGKCSFDGDTQVLMADGTTKSISKIQVGDEVLAADPESGEKGPRTVMRVWVHDDTVVDLVTEDGAKITTTEDHPFWNATDRQWQRADQLDRGDSLLSAAGQLVKVVGLRSDGARASVAFNLTVKDIHTFHVLAGGRPVLVHNTCPRFVHDEWWEDRVVLSDGNEYVFGGFVEDNGTTTLNLWDAYVWPADRKGMDLGANRGALGTGGAAELMRMIYNRYLPQARSQGYTHLRIQGIRVTGGKQGHVFDERFPRGR